MKLYVPQCFLAFREWTVGEVPGKRGADQRTFSGNRVQRMQDVYGEFACGASSSTEYVVNVFLTRSRRSS
jgi:hypothetical protein